MARLSSLNSSLSILYVSYPLLAVSEKSPGGAEQMLLTLEREMRTAGHRVTVAACDGSVVEGRLLATGRAAAAQDEFEKREREQSGHILRYLQAHPGQFDLIHDESGSFFRHAGRCPAPVLATLHLPRSFYREEGFRKLPENLAFNCVSHSQARSFEDLPNLLGVAQNGIAVERFAFCEVKQEYLLWLGRICEEKAPHLAIAAAREAGARLIIAGQVYPFRYHRQYFERELKPHLGDEVRLVESPTFESKVALLRNARAVLLTSTVEETSSLVAMEAMACGTPVIAMRRGAFPEIVAHGETGFIVDDVSAMAAAIAQAEWISPFDCRERVERLFSVRRMAREYEALYRRVLASQRGRVAA